MVNNDGLHGMVEAAGTIGLKAGKHAIEVRFFENGAGEGLEVRYQGPGISKQLIPDSALYRVNGSSLREPENPINTTNGLVHNYYTGTWSLLPDFTSLTPANTGTCANFTLSAYGSRAVDNFGYTYTGYVDVPSDGTYTFYTTSDDGSKLFIGTTQVVNNDGLHAMVEASGTIGLKAGKHAIEVRFFENSGGENMEVRYEGPGLSKQFIPGTSLYRVSGGGTAPSAPSAPSGLSATAASNSQINLNWTDNANNEDNFRIERKTGAGGTWAEIATVGAGVTTYSNTGLSASTQFYYRLRSYNTTGYSAYSSETNATTQSSGQTSYGGAVRTIPGTIEAEDFDSGGQGVAYHDTDAANTGGQYRTSESVDIETTSDVGGGSSVGWTMNGEWLEYTVNVTGGTYNLTFRVATPNTGGQLRVLLDGLDVGSVTIPNTGGWQTWTNVELTGKTLASGNGKVLRLEFPIGNFNLNKTIVEAVGVPSPWLSADIGSVGVAGNTSYDGGTAAFNINGSGADIWDTADAFRYVYHSGSGDCDIKCKVTAVQNTDPWAKAGVMIRETLDANSKNVAMVMTPGNGANFQYRPNTGGISYYTVSPGKTVPYWVRVNRTGNVFKGYISTDGVSWTQVGVDQNITMATGVYIGMAVTSHNNTVTCTSTESSVTAAP